ncbi:MAG: GtrA family protein [Legionellales bacterium]
MTATLKLKHRLAYYLGIGGISALVNLGLVVFLVSHWGFHPLSANVFAFLIAFNISFLGHKYLTFSKLNDQKKLRLPHFFLVALSGGLINESLYFLILRYTHLNYLFSLILVLGLVSIYSYFFSRLWACR